MVPETINLTAHVGIGNLVELELCIAPLLEISCLHLSLQECAAEHASPPGPCEHSPVVPCPSHQPPAAVCLHGQDCQGNVTVGSCNDWL